MSPNNKFDPTPTMSLVLFLSLFLLLPSSSTAQSNKNISLGSSLTASQENQFWLSPSRDFAFGFQQIENQGYFLAIWFNKINEKTIVWSANRNDPLLKGSKLELTTTGQFVLSDPNDQKIWEASLDTSDRVSYASMLDNGNFVLASNNSTPLWQSFDEPTDTLLPSQTLKEGSQLVSSYSETNYSSGRFKFQMQTDGNLVLYTRAFPLDDNVFAYWASNTNDGFQLIFNLSGSIDLTARNGSILTTISSDTSSTADLYKRAILEYDGVFRQYVYPKNANTNGTWREAWSQVSKSLPLNICTQINGDTYGSGACGFNSYCILGADQRPDCRCPRGYNFIDPNDKMSGCRPDFLPQSCDKKSPETDLFEFVDLQNSNWPFSDTGRFLDVTEDWCRRECLVDCFCAAVIFGGGTCWKKKSPLSNGRMDPSVDAKSLIKIRKGNSASGTLIDFRKKDNKTLVIIGSVLLSSSVFFNLMLLLVTTLIVIRFNRMKTKTLQTHDWLPGVKLRVFSYKELHQATAGFKELLGTGAFATVYKGVIESEDNDLVAVKKLNNMVKEGDQEFKAEISAISRTNHKNLVQLLGFCNEGLNKLLVYEFMSNGSLASFLFGSSSRPNWYHRVQIALGTARGLLYLHEECSTQIIHCDIKPQNILLDDNLAPRISDFGLAKLLKTDQTRTTTVARGTKGYVAPEWFRNMPITAKVDVYSFGILLLELICCRKSFEVDAETENQMILVDWACDCFKERKLEMLVERDEEAINDLKRVEKYVMIAIWCVQEEPSLRPTMKKVAQMLEGAVSVPIPPDPSSFISAI